LAWCVATDVARQPPSPAFAYIRQKPTASAKRLTRAQRRLLSQEPVPEQPAAAAWIKPAALTKSVAAAVLDADVAAGLEFLAGLGARLQALRDPHPDHARGWVVLLGCAGFYWLRSH
jgi:hypothetical protein